MDTAPRTAPPPPAPRPSARGNFTLRLGLGERAILDAIARVDGTTPTHWIRTVAVSAARAALAERGGDPLADPGVRPANRGDATWPTS